MATTAKSVILRDKDDGKQLLPMTRAELVIGSDGTSVETSLANKQDALVSGTNIKTVNNESLLGDGNLEIQSGGGTEHNLKVSPNSVFDQKINGQVNSTRIFPFSEVGNACAIIRSLLVNSGSISRYNAGTILGFYKSSNTYLEAKIDQYNLIVRLVVNGSTVHTTTVGNITTLGLDANGDYAVRYNSSDKTFRFFSYSSGAVTNIASVDVSTWDLSSLDNVYIVTSVNNFFNYVVCNTVLVNCPSLLSDYMAVPMNYGFYNVPQGTSYNENIYLAGQGLTMGGTVVETISATDKVISVSNASLSYFSMGPSNLDDRFGFYHLRLKFNSVGSGAYFSPIGETMGPAFFEKDGIVTKVRAAADKFYPVEGETYDMYYEFQGKETQSYQRSYAMRVIGDLTFEVSQPYMFNKQIQNLCAETYNGDGFTGAIPSEGLVYFKDYSGNNSLTPTTIRIPLGTTAISNGTIYMWEGTVWKRINNT